MRPMAVTQVTTVTHVSGSSSFIHPRNNNIFWHLGFHSESAWLVGASGHKHGAWGAFEVQWWGDYFFDKKLSMDGCMETVVVAFCFGRPTRALDANTSTPGAAFLFEDFFGKLIN